MIATLCTTFLVYLKIVSLLRKLIKNRIKKYEMGLLPLEFLSYSVNHNLFLNRFGCEILYSNNDRQNEMGFCKCVLNYSGLHCLGPHVEAQARLISNFCEFIPCQLYSSLVVVGELHLHLCAEIMATDLSGLTMF